MRLDGGSENETRRGSENETRRGLGSKLHGVPFCVGGPLSPQTAGARKYLEGVSKATDGL